jgi:prolyl oligopeptidase
MSACFRLLLCFALALLATLAFATPGDQSSSSDQSNPRPPQAKREPVEETLHGVKIVDQYRWLEDGSSPETEAFVRDEMAYTRALLDKQPQMQHIKDRLEKLLTIGSIGTPTVRGNYYFHTQRDGNQNQPILYVREGVSGKDRVLLDPNSLSADGTVALDWWHPSHDGKYVAYGTSPGGSEISTLYVLETATGKLLDEKIPQTRAASIGWLADDSAFYYTRFPKPGSVPKGQEMYNRHVFFHKIGENDNGDGDAAVFGEGQDPQTWPNLVMSDDGRWMVILMTKGSAGHTDIYLLDTSKPGNEVKTVAKSEDIIYTGQVYKDELYIVTNEGAPRFRVYKVKAADPKKSDWKEIIPQTNAVLTNLDVIGGKLFASYEKDASSQLKIFSLDGKPLSSIALPAIGSVTAVNGEVEGKEAFYGFTSFTIPPSIYRYDLATAKSTVWAKVDAPVNSSDYDVKQVFYASKDGTKIPMFIVAKKGLVLNGQNPTMLTGYGGFNLSRTPSFSGWLHLWLESGGVYADANLRGGSEYGEDWHRAGMLDKKQNVFDDFTYAAKYLIAQKYTSTPHLAIYGRSNGGLLVGATETQHPEMFRAVVCGVGLLDMLRYQKFQIAKLWIPEYGSSDDPEQFKWLYAYSPYHHVKPGTTYPATLFFASEGDTRVDPLHTRKMTAEMQHDAANGPDRPILMRIETKAGHGVGKPISKQIDEWADIYTFLFWQLGMK